MNFKKIVFFVTFVLPSALFTSDHSEKTAENNKSEEAKKNYQKGDDLYFKGDPLFKVLADGPPLRGYVHVRYVKTGQEGLFNPEAKYFANGFTYETINDLFKFLEKRGDHLKKTP